MLDNLIIVNNGGGVMSEVLKVAKNLARVSDVLLEYYLVEPQKSVSEYGVKIVKRKKGEEENIEEYTQEYVSDDVKKVTQIIRKLAKNTVTPISAKYVLEDLL